MSKFREMGRIYMRPTPQYGVPADSDDLAAHAMFKR
jgi:hypothetical protein